MKRDGWYQVRQSGSHRHFAHPTKPGTVTVPMHRGDVPQGTLHGIITTMGLTVAEFRRLL